MAEQDDRLEENQEEIKVEDQPHQDMSDAYFEMREKRWAAQRDGVEQKEVEKKEPDQKDVTSQKEPVEKETKEKPSKAIEDTDTDTEVSLLRKQLEESKSRINDNQKLGRQSMQKIKSALNLVKEMTDSGLLDEEDAERFAQVLNVDPKYLEEDEKPDMYSLHPLGKLLKIADAELVNMKKYTDDELLDEKIKSFNHFISGDDESVPDVMEELNDLADDPVALTKKMLQVGKKHFDEVYGELKKSGGLSLYLKKFKEKEERLVKQIDKMRKKLSEYEDYNDSSYRIDSVSDRAAANEHRKDMSDSYYDQREKRYSENRKK